MTWFTKSMLLMVKTTTGLAWEKKLMAESTGMTGLSSRDISSTLLRPPTPTTSIHCEHKETQPSVVILLWIRDQVLQVSHSWEVLRMRSTSLTVRRPRKDSVRKEAIVFGMQTKSLQSLPCVSLQCVSSFSCPLSLNGIVVELTITTSWDPRGMALLCQRIQLRFNSISAFVSSLERQTWKGNTIVQHLLSRLMSSMMPGMQFAK